MLGSETTLPWVTGTFVPMYFRSRERKFHLWNFCSQERLLPGTFALWNFHSLELSFPGAKVTWNFRSLELSLPGTFVPWNFCSPYFLVIYL